MHIHTGVGHTDKSAQHFWLRKTHNFFLCAWRGSNFWSLDLGPPLYQLRQSVIPIEYRALLQDLAWPTPVQRILRRQQSAISLKEMQYLLYAQLSIYTVTIIQYLNSICPCLSLLSTWRRHFIVKTVRWRMKTKKTPYLFSFMTRKHNFQFHLSDTAVTDIQSRQGHHNWHDNVCIYI